MVDPGLNRTLEVPPGLIVSIVRWVIDGSEPDRSVRAILTNDLFMTVHLVGRDEMRHMRDVTQYLNANIPFRACGSYMALDLWKKWGGLRGEAMPTKVRLESISQFEPLQHQTQQQVDHLLEMFQPEDVEHLSKLTGTTTSTIMSTKKEIISR